MEEYNKIIDHASQAEKNGNFEDAYLHYEKAIALNPREVIAYYNRASFYLLQNKQDEAISDFEKAAELKPEDASVYNNLGVLYHGKGQFEDAEKNLKKALTLDPDYLEPTYSLAKLYLMQEKLKDAILMLIKCLKIDVNFEKANKSLIKIVQEAIDNKEKSRHINNAEELVILGNGCLALKKDKDAMEFFTEATCLAPEYSEGWYQLGKFYQEQKNWEKAITNYENCLRIYPENSDAQERFLYCKIHLSSDFHKEPEDPYTIIEKGLKPHILFVGPKWVDGKPEIGLVNQSHNLWGSLEATGLTTQDRFHFDDHFICHKETGDYALLRLCTESKPNLLFLDWQHGLPYNPKLETLRLINQKMKIPIVAVWWDHVWDVHIKNAENIQECVDLNIVVDTSVFFHKVSNPEKYLLLWTPQDPRIYYTSDDVRDIPISFAGRTAKIGRREAIDSLKAANIGFYYPGGGKDERRLSLEEYASTFRHSKIAVNFSGSFSNHKQLVGRVMEITLSGAMLLEEDNPETAGLFQPMMDYVPFTDIKDLVNKAKYYLEHGDERMAIAKNGYQKAASLYNNMIFWRTVFYHLNLQKRADQKKKNTIEENNKTIAVKTETKSSVQNSRHKELQTQKLKVFIYPDAKPVNCDDNPYFANTAPLSRQGISTWIEKASPEDAEFFYMGQTTDSTINEFDINKFSYFNGNEERHIIDIEGDWHNLYVDQIHPWLKNSIINISGNASCRSIKDWNVCARPPFSYLLVDMLKSRHERFSLPKDKTFGFKGCLDKGLFRLKVAKALKLSNVKCEYIINQQWFGRTKTGHPEVKKYEQFMQKHLFALCPRGTGNDSVRFYEACFFERVPVVISDSLITGEDYYDMSFIFRISARLSEQEMAEEFLKIAETPIDEAIERGKRAKQYFEDVLRIYYKDPTKYFIKFLNRKQLRFKDKIGNLQRTT
ncbi:MAG: tetratricopeptide repeat protein [Candidatus Kuenenia sp.]|nr:tetratricopeptide repeat protein [Candidatus Kuenenia hertensis]